MNPLRFEAPNMRQALDDVRSRLGSDAVILESRSRRDNGSAGGVTVLAVPGSSAPGRAPAPSAPATPSLEAPSDLRADLGECRLMLHALLADRLRGADPDERQRLAGAVPLAGGIDLDRAPAVVALVGPTGGGKTSTVARLAAAVAAQRRQVRVITGDTHRAHAAESLQACCAILGLVVEVASTPDDVAAVVADSDSVDCILLDTPGISPRDDSALGELREWLAAAAPTEVHLVLPATASRRALEGAIQAFGGLPADRIILSKTDEPADPAEALAAVIASGLPLSYLTEAPGAADGLRLADSDRLTRLLTADDGEEVRDER